VLFPIANMECVAYVVRITTDMLSRGLTLWVDRVLLWLLLLLVLDLPCFASVCFAGILVYVRFNKLSHSKKMPLVLCRD